MWAQTRRDETRRAVCVLCVSGLPVATVAGPGGTEVRVRGGVSVCVCVCETIPSQYHVNSVQTLCTPGQKLYPLESSTNLCVTFFGFCFLLQQQQYQQRTQGAFICTNRRLHRVEKQGGSIGFDWCALGGTPLSMGTFQFKEPSGATGLPKSYSVSA